MFPCPSGLSYRGQFLCIVPEVSFGEGHVFVPGRHARHEGGRICKMWAEGEMYVIRHTGKCIEVVRRSCRITLVPSPRAWVLGTDYETKT